MEKFILLIKKGLKKENSMRLILVTLVWSWPSLVGHFYLFILKKVDHLENDKNSVRFLGI